MAKSNGIMEKPAWKVVPATRYYCNYGREEGKWLGWSYRRNV